MRGEPSLIDRTQPVRRGEEIDLERLRDYLRQNLPDLSGPLSIEQFPAGFSNLTYLIRAGARQLVLRRPPIGAKIKTAHDMGREFTILSGLHPIYPKVPRPLLFCQDDSVVGAPFYVMERIEGIILRAQPPREIKLTPELMRRLSETFIATLVEIHNVDYLRAGLENLGAPDGYVKRQVEGWIGRYQKSRTDDVPEIDRLARWLSENMPEDSKPSTLIHNDYKYDNIVLAPGDMSKALAVLDWEMATIGDPLMDFGTTLGYWVDADDSSDWQQYAFGITMLPGSFSRTEIVQRYADLSGRDLSNVVFYYVFGLLKIAVIVQQIYFRYRQGLTADERFSRLDRLVKACGTLAGRAIEKGRIDRLG
jgi:aminoglycoside phosphotransferase (APT) family kinase protein